MIMPYILYSVTNYRSYKTEVINRTKVECHLNNQVQVSGEDG